MKTNSLFISKRILVKDVVEFIGEQLIEVRGDYSGIYIEKFRPPESVDELTLDWISSTRQDKQSIAETSPARVIICDPDVGIVKGKVLIIVKNPRMVVAQIVEKFFVEKPSPGISQSAFVDHEADISEEVYIGPNCSIGKARIGRNTVIMPNVVIYDNVEIGEDCLIQAGAVIGTDGLGCSRGEEGILIKFPHLGRVILGDRVEIGANCQIARGVFSDTIISNGVKINGMCFIAHNCVLSENVWITGSTMLSGSVKVGKNTTIFSKVVVREQVTLGEDVTIGMGSVVTKDIPDGEMWYGNPAKKR